MKPSEKTWLAAATALVLVMAAAPYAIGWLTAPSGQPFSGILVERQDGFSYLAKMRLGAAGGWLFQDRYATELHPATPLFSVFILLGHIASPASDPRVPLETLASVYALARIVFGALFLGVLYRFIATFIEDITGRRIAWALIVVCAGLGWLLLGGQGAAASQPPLDLYLGEANTIVPLLAYPHVLLGRAALLAGTMCLMRADQISDWRFAAAAGGFWLAATLAVPFEVLVAGGMVGGWIVARWASTGRLPWRLAGMGLLAGLPGAALNAITLVIIGNDPIYASWTAQNKLPLPPVGQLLATFSLQTALGIVGAVVLWREKARHSDLLIGWAAASPLLILVPLPFQLRFIEGFSIPLGILASAALTHISVPRLQRAAVMGVLALLLPSTLLLTVGGGAAALGGFGRFSAGQAATLEWLRVHADQDSVVLSSADFGVIIPAAAPLRAALGHGFETPEFETTQTSIRQIYAGLMSRDSASAWLAARHVRYIVFGPDEARLSGVETTPIVAELSLHEVFAQDGYRIYEMRSP